MTNNFNAYKEAKKRNAIEGQQALEWSNKNREIVKRELGNFYSTIDLVELWKHYTTPQDNRTLSNKINWKAGEDILRTHLEKLRDNKFIDYKNIDAVISGDEIAVFIKHNSGKLKSSQNNATALFRFWNKNKLITDYIFNTTNQDTGEAEEKESHNYICDAFYREKKENPFNYGSLKNNAKDPQRKHSIDNIIIHLESILI